MWRVVLLTPLLLCGCGPNFGSSAIFICEERDVVSAVCTKGRYVCPSPMEMSQWQGVPRCTMKPDAGERYP